MTTSPSLLTPKPKRAPGVKRLNSVPIVIGVGVVAIFLSVVTYTMVQRAHKDKAEEGGKSRIQQAARRQGAGISERGTGPWTNPVVADKAARAGSSGHN